jgi:hypothetical protein
MATQSELDDFDNLFKSDIKTTVAAMNGEYAKELQDLLHLSGDAETQGSIAIMPTEAYSQLIALVQRASAMNLSEAELKSRIEGLGSTAVALAKKVTGLAELFG